MLPRTASPSVQDRDPRHRIDEIVATNNAADRGSVSLELVIMAPALVVVVLFIIAGGRVAQAHQAVEAAARDAARQASISRDPQTARMNAISSAQAALSRDGLQCPARVQIDTTGFARPVGEPASVSATVSCTVRLGDVALSGVPTTTVVAHFTSPIDPYRGRQS